MLPGLTSLTTRPRSRAACKFHDVSEQRRKENTTPLDDSIKSSLRLRLPHGNELVFAVQRLRQKEAEAQEGRQELLMTDANPYLQCIGQPVECQMDVVQGNQTPCERLQNRHGQDAVITACLHQSWNARNALQSLKSIALSAQILHSGHLCYHLATQGTEPGCSARKHQPARPVNAGCFMRLLAHNLHVAYPLSILASFVHMACGTIPQEP